MTYCSLFVAKRILSRVLIIVLIHLLVQHPSIYLLHPQNNAIPQPSPHKSPWAAESGWRWSRTDRSKCTIIMCRQYKVYYCARWKIKFLSPAIIQNPIHSARLTGMPSLKVQCTIPFPNENVFFGLWLLFELLLWHIGDNVETLAISINNRRAPPKKVLNRSVHATAIK